MFDLCEFQKEHPLLLIIAIEYKNSLYLIIFKTSPFFRKLTGQDQFYGNSTQ